MPSDVRAGMRDLNMGREGGRRKGGRRKGGREGEKEGGGREEG